MGRIFAANVYTNLYFLKITLYARQTRSETAELQSTSLFAFTVKQLAVQLEGWKKKNHRLVCWVTASLHHFIVAEI